MSKIIQFDKEVLKSILKGVKTLAKAVATTLGPKGRNVVINRGFGAPLSTKDGVTVAKEIVLKDKYENMGAQLVKEAASKMADLAGDGTTTTIVLAEALYSEGVKLVMAGHDPMSLKRGIERGAKEVSRALDQLATPVSKPEEIEQVARVSANNDREIGLIIAEAMKRVGKEGLITVADSKGIETTLEVTEGMELDKGYLSPYFITHAEKMTAEFEGVSLLITDKKIGGVKELAPLLEKVMEKGTRPLLIIAEEVEGEALSMLVVNKVKASLPVCAIKAPGFGDKRKALLEDIAILTGATVITEEVGLSLEDFELAHLGRAEKIKVGKETTLIVKGLGEAKKIEERCLGIRSAIEKATSDHEKNQLEERLAKLSGGVGVIKVGAPSETEQKEKKARVEDALCATRLAIKEGVVPGGGVALLRAVRALDALSLQPEEQLGVGVVREALYAPARAIAANCGRQGNLIAEKIFERQGAWGYNGLTGEFADLLKEGVVDPVLVTKSALLQAASLAGALLTIAVMVTDKPERKRARAPSAEEMGGMDEMGMM